MRYSIGSRLILLFALLLLSPRTEIGAQQVSIIPISEADTKEARETFERLLQAQQQWRDLQQRVRAKYAALPASVRSTPARPIVRVPQTDGSEIDVERVWMEGITFSQDFRYIMPISSYAAPGQR